MRFLTFILATALATAPTFAQTIEERVERMERLAYIEGAAFLLGGVENCGIDIPQDRIREFMLANGGDDPVFKPLILRNAYIGAFASMTAGKNQNSPFCADLREKLPVYGLAD